MSTELSQWLRYGHWTDAEIAQRHKAVYERVLGESRSMQGGNFTAIGTRDLDELWRACDELFFAGLLARSLAETPLRFRVSRRLTSSAGQATRRTVVRGPARGQKEYEISVSATLLFQAFAADDRPVTVSGILCRDRLEALQRVFEHELIHLAEMIVWTDSSCSAPRFQSISRRLFGHREHTHQLITPQERAWTRLGLRVGDRVRFCFDGRQYEGYLNRITRRATVLVEDERGVRYRDGRRYSKFYVPLTMLSKPPST